MALVEPLLFPHGSFIPFWLIMSAQPINNKPFSILLRALSAKSKRDSYYQTTDCGDCDAAAKPRATIRLTIRLLLTRFLYFRLGFKVSEALKNSNKDFTFIKELAAC